VKLLWEDLMSKINHYDVLGVPRDCEQSLIDTVYKSMVKIFHPDVFKGDKTFAQEKLKVINEAYAVIGNVERRKSYDAELKRSENSGATEEIYEDGDQNQQPFDDMYADEWKVVIGYFPEIDTMYTSLKKLNFNLALSFKVELISKKNYRDATLLSEKLKRNFLTEKFGSNSNLHLLVVSAIESGNRQFALDLNKDLRILGEDEQTAILNKLAKKYPKFCTVYYPKFGFQRLIGTQKWLQLTPGKYRTFTNQFFGITPSFTAYFVVPGFFGDKSYGYPSIDKLIEAGCLTADEVYSADKVS
jgi:curved DNA-binding protein CbpA